MSSALGKLVAQPSSEGRDLDRISHRSAWPEEFSILLLVEDREQGFPILSRILRGQYGAEGVFGIDRDSQVLLLNEIERLRKDIEFRRTQSETREHLREAVRYWQKRNRGRINVEGVSPEAALYGLVKMKEFIEEVLKRRWYLVNETE